MLWRVVKYVILAVVLHRIAFLVRALGFHKTVYKHYPGSCRVIESLDKGSEDMEWIPGNKVLITAELRLDARYNSYYAGRSAKVYMFDFNYLDRDPELVKIAQYPGDMSEADFHGMSVWVDPNTGVVTIFIVNHYASYSTVEIFTYNDAENTLYHKKTCVDDTFRTLNDVVAVSGTEFYVTNFAHMQYNLGKVEAYLQLKWGAVVFYDGKHTNVVQAGLVMPNGINKSPDGRYIYVAHLNDRQISVYERNADNNITLKQDWATYTTIDNIMVDAQTGDLWAACHAVTWKTVHYLENPSAISPSQVLHLWTKDGLIVDMTEPFADDGHLISGSSVAVFNGNKLLIGSVASQTVICDVDHSV